MGRPQPSQELPVSQYWLAGAFFGPIAVFAIFVVISTHKVKDEIEHWTGGWDFKLEYTQLKYIEDSLSSAKNLKSGFFDYGTYFGLNKDNWRLENAGPKEVKRGGNGVYMNGKNSRAIDKDKRNKVIYFTLHLLLVHQNLRLKRKQAGGRGKYGCSRAA